MIKSINTPKTVASLPDGIDDKPSVSRGLFIVMQKATDQEIIDAYKRTGNLWKAAKELDMRGQTIHRRLIKLGIPRKNNPLSESEKIKIRNLYEAGFRSGDGALKKLSGEINRTVPFISRYAGKIGLSKYTRSKSERICALISNNTKNQIQKNGHPRGFLGHKRTPESIEKIKIAGTFYWMRITKKELAARTLRAQETLFKNGSKNGIVGDKKKSWKGEWHTIGGYSHYYRSSWEIKYAYYLEEKVLNGEIKDWQPEAWTFAFKDTSCGVRTYTPDFWVIENDDSYSFHEVKGWMDDRSKRCLELMKKKYPEIKIVLIDKSKYRQLFGVSR